MTEAERILELLKSWLDDHADYEAPTNHGTVRNEAAQVRDAIRMAEDGHWGAAREILAQVSW